MDDLVTWLRAQLSDDEREAHEQKRFDAWVDEQRGDHVDTIVIPPLSQLGSAGDPDRVLAEVDAKRQMLAHIGMVVISPGREALPAEYVAQMEWFLRLLALPYAGRDGWREEWAP
jgi:hypothetical protein